ncbi:MAG: hypothetical protein IT385_14440 [Deltaproteobacteria bacterium]|nr:hypothetical protein [Deltaproteobacteria bacterium]
MIVTSVAVGACGSDHTSKLKQIDDPWGGQSPLDPVDVAAECTTSASCEDGDRCTADRCVARRCVAIPVPSEMCCAATVLFEDDLDGSTGPKVTLTSLNGSAGWQLDTARVVSPPNALYFGDPVTRSYDKGTQVAGTVALPPVALPRDQSSVLSMRLYTLIETAPEYDLFWIEADVIKPGSIAATGGAGQVIETVRLLSKKDLPVSAFEDFALVDVPLTGLEGKDVVLRIRFDTLDGLTNAFEGIYLDDLKVEALCPIAVDCMEDADCADDDACTAEACTEAGCGYADVLCEEPVEDNPCDKPDAPADCCIADADCDDGDPTTIDVCDGATCVHTLNPDACTTPGDCDDGEVCTTESCNGGLCGFTGTIGPGCCEPGDKLVAGFDNESLQGIYVTDNFETGLFWRADKTRSTSGEFGLYCGDPVTQTYTHDARVKSSATTRPLTIPKGGQTTIEVDLYKDTRTAKNYDVFQVFVLRDGALLPLWTSKSLGDGTTQRAWQHLSIPLTTYAGQDVQVRFVFDSVDAPTSAFEGVYIDTIRLLTRCN